MNGIERVWKGMTSSERIVAMSLVAGGVIAIVNSTVWAVATCFIAYQRARVRVAQLEDQSIQRLGDTMAHSFHDAEAADTLDLPDLADDEAFPPDSLTIEKQ
jgi:hypothetical protein